MNEITKQANILSKITEIQEQKSALIEEVIELKNSMNIAVVEIQAKAERLVRKVDEYMKELKGEMKEFQKEMKDLKDDPKKMMEVQKRAMEKNMKYMLQSLKPTLFTFIPLILIFGWLRSYYAAIGNPAVLFGLGWIWIYIICSIAFSIGLRKLLKIY